MNAAFGGNLVIADASGNPNLTTPQGQLASSMTAIVVDKNNQILEIANMVDPAQASDRWQDAIGRIYFLNRDPALPTVIQVQCSGATGVTIPLGALVVDPSGYVYSCTQAGTIPGGGSITLPFANQTTGALAVPSSVSIYRTVSGWDSATFVSGVIGQDVESRSAFEYRRQQSVAINASGSLPSIYANVFAVANVLDVYVTENTTSSPITVGSTSYTLAPHSIYVAAVGGDQNAIAKAIWQRKSCGADYNGNTSVMVTDTSGYNVPYPTYTVKFNIPTTTTVYFAVNIANNASLPSNIVALTQAAIVNAFAGGDGGPRARVGSTIYASRFYAAVAAISPYVEILSIQIGLTASPASNSVTMGIDQEPSTSSANISVTLT
jgi:hypothetical protein